MHRRVSTGLAPLLYTGLDVTNGPILFYSYPGINQTNSILNNILAAFKICQCDWVTSIAQTPIYIMFGFIGLRFSVCLSRKRGWSESPEAELCLRSLALHTLLEVTRRGSFPRYAAPPAFHPTGQKAVPQPRQLLSPVLHLGARVLYCDSPVTLKCNNYLVCFFQLKVTASWSNMRAALQLFCVVFLQRETKDMFHLPWDEAQGSWVCEVCCGIDGRLHWMEEGKISVYHL